uniref:type II site-specific deoxyribonuclease n=1 Tax=Ignavibacterium album TaxID=591197 RepID=A0A7V2ZMR1_9BACT
MALTLKQKEKISVEVIKTLITRFETFPEDASNNRNAPFHEAFLKAFADKLENKVSDIPFFISLSSWLQGLNTTLGQSFFENVAHHLSNGAKREYTSRKLGNLKITRYQKDTINQIITNLSNSIATPRLELENSMIFKNDTSELVNAIDFSADVFIEDDNSITAIELKSVKPNSGEMRGEKQKILEGKAALYKHFPNKQINFYIGFPFDPTVNPRLESATSFDKSRFLNSIINMTKYFDLDETLVASELWDKLSGTSNTMEDILEIINTIATPSFLNKFQYLSNNSNRQLPEYKRQLEEWNLYSEIELINNRDSVIKNISSNKNLLRLYHNNIFDNKGAYNFERYTELINYTQIK